MSRTGDTSPHTSSAAGPRDDDATALPSRRRKAYLALTLFAILGLVQVVASVSALVAWRYPYEVRGAHTLSTAVHSGLPTDTLEFRVVLAVRQDVGLENLQRVAVPSQWDSRAAEFAGNILARRAVAVDYPWRLTDAAFDAMLSRTSARQVETGIYLATPPAAGDYALYADAKRERVLITRSSGGLARTPDAPGPP